MKYNINNYRIELDKLGKIIIYLRKSREDMIDGRYASDEETLSRHEEQLQTWAKNNLGYELPQENIFKEIGSGEKIKTRPVFQEVLNLIESGNIDGVLVLNVSRLSRGDLGDCDKIIKTLEITDTLVLTPAKLYNLKDKYDKRFFKDELLRGNDYLETTKELLSNGRHWSTSIGKYVNPKAPFGYDKVTCKEMNVSDGRGFTLKPNKDAKYVKLIFNMLLEGNGTYKIATHLNDINATKINDTAWDHCKVNRILKNITYSGYLTWGKRITQENIINGEVFEKRIRNKECPVYKGLHEAIISKEVFDCAQEKMKISSPPVKRSLETKNPLAGLIKCAICGKAMVRHAYNNSITLKRKHSIDKKELQQFLRYHKKQAKLSNKEIAERLNIKSHYINEWFGQNPNKFFLSDTFTDQWFNLKEILSITDNKYDGPITTFEDVTKEATIVCSGHRCSNIGSYNYQVENTLLQMIHDKFSDYNFFLDNYAEEIVKKVNSAKRIIENITEEIEVKKKQLKKVQIAYEKDVYTIEEYIERKKELNTEIDNLNAKKEEYTKDDEEEKTIVIKKAVPILQNVFHSYPSLEPSEKNELLKTIMSSVMYLKEDKEIKLDICWLI